MTKLQKIIIQRLIDGWTNEQIVAQLNYSPSAIAYHISKLFKYYKVKNRMELVLKIVLAAKERMKID